jgi:hypothetical protein
MVAEMVGDTVFVELVLVLRRDVWMFGIYLVVQRICALIYAWVLTYFWLSLNSPLERVYHSLFVLQKL